MKQRRFAGIIEAQEEDLGLLLPEAERREDSIEPIEQKHDPNNNHLDEVCSNQIESRSIDPRFRLDLRTRGVRNLSRVVQRQRIGTLVVLEREREKRYVLCHTWKYVY